MALRAFPLARPLILLALAALLIGCETTQAPVQLPAEHRPTSVEPAPVEDDLINRLLEAAARALAEHRLTAPVPDNAYSLYQEVLKIDPDDPTCPARFREDRRALRQAGADRRRSATLRARADDAGAGARG